MTTEAAGAVLRAAWDEFVTKLEAGRDALDAPELHAPPPTTRGLAEGYRYLLGFAYSAVERAFHEDADFPYFRRAISPVDKATIDNADALYLSARIDGSRAYRVRGRVASHEHWKGQERTGSGPWAPQYAIFEVHSRYPGDTGTIVELMPGNRVITGFLDSTELQVEEDGRFEVLVAPSRPDGHTGNFLSTLPDDPDSDHRGSYVIVRFLFHDWENEVAPELSIFPVELARPHPAPLDPETAAVKLVAAGDLVANQMRFWNEFYDVVIGAFGEGNPNAFIPSPRNDINTPTLASLASGGGQSTNVYAGGRWLLQPGEALLIETRSQLPTCYQSIHLANVWGESLDYANHVSSLNGFQAEADADGTTRYVIAHEDPGIPNWLDTTGLEEGFISLRWTHHAPPAPTELPSATARKVALSELESLLAATTRKVAPAEREQQLQVRREHVQRRYRQY